MIGTYVQERLRWRREDELRFNQEKRQAYTQFLALIYLNLWIERPCERRSSS